MTKTQLKQLIKECVNEVIRDARINESSEEVAVSDINAQKDMYTKFDIDYSEGATFSNNLLALYGIGKRGRSWLTDFEDNHGDPMSKENIIKILNQTGLSRLSKLIPSNYDSSGGFKGSSA